MIDMLSQIQFALSPILLFTMPPQAWPMISVAFGLGIAVAILFRLVAAITQHPEHKALANEELAAVLFSAFIIAFWVGMDAFLQNLINALVSIPTTTGASFQGLSTAHLDLAAIQLSVFQSQLTSLYLRLSLIDFFIGFLSTIGFNLGTLPGSIGFFSLYIAPYGGFGLISNALTKIIDGVMLIGLTTWSKQMLIILAKTTIPLIFLPLGLVMRAIPFTRTTGSTIIAVCFALYFVYPLAVSLSFYMIFDIYHLEFDRTYIESVSPFKTQMNDVDINNFVGAITKNDENLQNVGGENKGEVVAKSIAEACGIQQTDGIITTAAKYLLCAADKIVNAVVNATSSTLPAVSNVILTVWNAMKEMITYSGSFFSSMGSILLPVGMTLGAYTFLTDIITKSAELFVAVIVATVLEIMITVTMYRNIALLIGGEAELPGLSKLV